MSELLKKDKEKPTGSYLKDLVPYFFGAGPQKVVNTTLAPE